MLITIRVEGSNDRRSVMRTAPSTLTKEGKMISKSISYKLVNKSTGLVEAEGNAKAMRKLRKQQPEQFEVYLSTNKPMIGQKM